jgi:hypothetical protein
LVGAYPWRRGMLSGKLVHLIETNEDEIARRILIAIRRNSGLAHLSVLPNQELRERAEQILKNLGHWLAYGHELKLAREYEALARERFDQGVPLQEAVSYLFLIKEKTIEFLDEQGVDIDSLALYAEEQFERRLGRFFDLLLIHLVRGYETAWRHAVHLAA